MATKPKTKPKSTSGSSRRKTAKQKEAERRASRQMWAVILFALGIFLAAVTYIEGASLWKGLHLSLFGLCGFGAYLVAPVLLYIAVLLAQDRDTPSPAALGWQSGILLLLISGALQILGTGIPETKGFLNTFFALFDSGVARTGGGVLGGLIGVPLHQLFGKTGAIVAIFLLIFVFVMLLTGTTLMGLFRTAAKPVQKIGEAANDVAEGYIATREERIATREDRREQRRHFNIDIPLDAAPLPMNVPQEAESPVITVEALTEPEEIPLPPAPPEPEEKPATNDKNAYIDDIIRRMVQNQQDAVPVVSPVLPVENLPEEELPLPEDGQAEDEQEAALLESQEVMEKPAEENHPYVFPSITLLNEPIESGGGDSPEELRANAQRLVETLQSFGVQTRILDISRGPAVTRYELQPSAGVKISKITGLADDIALNLAASGVRIEAPIPNKAAVGIEIPNRTVQPVTLREVLDTTEFTSAKSKLTVAMGRDIAGNITLADISKMPHVLIAGATGSGKSVCINTIIMSLLYKASSDEVKFLMIDPKVVELGIYNGIPQLLVPVVTDPKKAAGALNWAVKEMLKRYQTFAENSVRDLASYNALAENSETLPKLPQIVIIIDELSDLMMAAPSEVEDAICRLAQMARAAGMHLVIATQRPSVDVITGIIKANIPSRIAFAVSSQVDSRTILDGAGAEKLLGRGDMLFAPVGVPKPIRVQGCFVTDKEVERVVSFIKEGEKHQYDQEILEEIERSAPVEKGSSSGGGGFADSDELLMVAIESVVETGQASTSFLQRRLKVGYARAGRLIDEMEQMGIVGPFEGSKPRQTLISKERWYEMKLGAQQPAPPTDQK